MNVAPPPYRWEGVPPEWMLSGSVVAAEARDRLEPDWARLRLSAAGDKKRSRQTCTCLCPGPGTREATHTSSHRSVTGVTGAGLAPTPPGLLTR